MADLAEQLPAEVIAHLELPALFKNWATTEHTAFPVLFSMWQDKTLRTNVLSSYLGAASASGLRLIAGDDLYRYLMQTPASSGYEPGIQALLENAHQPGVWSVVFTATNGAPLREPHASMMDQVIQRLRLAELLEHDVLEAEQLILLAGDFVTRNRPAAVVQHLFKQLLEFAAKCFNKFHGVQLSPGSQDAPSRLGAALLEGTWECSLVRDDVSATMAKFTDNLSLLISNWPEIAGLAHAALAGIMQTLPVQHQNALWRATLLCRAIA